MSLPASLGKPGASAPHLVDESMALIDPLGVSILSLKPEDFQDDLEHLGVRLHDRVDNFVAALAKGNPAKAKELEDAIADGCKHIPECLARSAGNPKYADGHAGWMKNAAGESMGGMIVEPREANYSFLGSAAYATGLAPEKFAQMNVSDAQGRFLTHWHEVAHCAGAYAEPNADKIGAIMARKAFPDSNMLQHYADIRALDALFSINLENPQRRLNTYGWAMVEAVDSVIAMPADKVRDMSEKEILSYRTEKFERKPEAVQEVWDAINKVAPDVLKERSPQKAAEALRVVLDGTGLADPDTRKMAGRFLQAIERTAPAPVPEVDSRYTSTTASVQRAHTLKY